MLRKLFCVTFRNRRSNRLTTPPRCVVGPQAASADRNMVQHGFVCNVMGGVLKFRLGNTPRLEYRAPIFGNQIKKGNRLGKK